MCGGWGGGRVEMRSVFIMCFVEKQDKYHKNLCTETNSAGLGKTASKGAD